MKKRRRWWWAVAILPVVLLLAFLGVVFLPHIVTGERLRMEAVSALTDLLGAPVSIDRVEYHPFRGVEIEKLTIGPPQGFSENVLAIDRAVVHYQLAGILRRHIVVSEVRVVAPIITIETRGGMRNIDAILAHLSREKKEEQEEAEPSEGPLLPLDIDLIALEIAPVSLLLAGEGMNAKLERAKLLVDGHAGRERLDLDVVLGIDPTDADNVAVAVPPVAGRRALDVLAHLSFTMKIELRAATASGLALEKATVHIEAANRLAAKWGEEAIEPAALSMVLDVSIDPASDQAKVERMELSLDGAPLVVARGELDGIAALVGALSGEAMVATLGSSVGLVDRKRQGSVDLAVERVLLPLDRFERWAKLFIPDLEMGGRVEMAPFVVSGNAREIAAGTPSKFRFVMKLEEASVSSPSMQIAIGKIGGSIEGARKEEGGYTLGGALSIGEVVQAKNRIGEVLVELAATADRVRYPEHGRLDAKVGLALSGIEARPARVKRADVRVSLSGMDPLSPARGPDPITVRAEIDAPSVRVATASAALDASGIQVVLNAALDRLIQPANEPIEAKLDVSLAKASLGRRSLERVRVQVTAKADDPRKGPFDADLDLDVKLGEASAPPAMIADATVRAKIGAKQVALPELPRQVALKLAVASPSVALSDRELGDLATPLSVEAAVHGDPVGGAITLEKLAVDLQDVLTLRAKGRGARLLGDAPWIDGEVEIGPVHLDKLAEKLPRGLMKAIPDLKAEGKLEMSARAKGTVPTRFEKTSLVHHPIEGNMRVAFDGVGVSSKRKSILLENLNGTIVGEVGGGKVETRTELDAARIIQGRPPLQNHVESLTVRNQIKLEDEVWTAASHVQAASVRSAYGGEGAVEGASIDLDLTYPLRGDLDLTRFDVHAPGNGIELAVNGRLRRRTFGVMRPDLSVRANLDLDRLRHLLPQIAGGRGKAVLALSVATRSDRVVDVEGSVEANRFTWEVPRVLTVLNATGRLPVSQRILLPPPELDVEVARSVGALGDDFEARADELMRDFERARGLLLTEDILVEAPRSADYQTLRPYYAASGARLTIDGIVYRQHAIEDITLEGMWTSGVLRIDRMACRLWEGDVLGDLAVQFTPDQNVRMRMRGTITDLNIDLPYAIIKGVQPVMDEEEKKEYRVSGQMDLEFALKQRAVNARIDLTKLKLPLVRRIFATMDLPDRAKSALEMAQLAGVRPTSGKIWIANNLLNVNFDWERLWLHVSLDQESFFGKALDVMLFPFRVFAIPTVGAYVIQTVNDTIRDFSISAVLDDLIGQARVEDQLRLLEGRVIAADKVDGSLPNQVSADMLSPR